MDRSTYCAIIQDCDGFDIFTCFDTKICTSTVALAATGAFQSGHEKNLQAQHLVAIGSLGPLPPLRRVVNLDPAAENFLYDCYVDALWPEGSLAAR